MSTTTALMLTGKRPAATTLDGEQQVDSKKSGTDDGMNARIILPHSRNNGDGNSAIAVPTVKFTHVHLQLLKVLYASREGGDDRDDDSCVKTEQWKQMQDFLQNRENVKTMAAKVKQSEAIQKGTSFFEELVEKSPSIMAITSFFPPVSMAAVTCPSKSRSSASSKMLLVSSRANGTTTKHRGLSARRLFGHGAGVKFASSTSPGSGRYSARKQQQQQPIIIDVDANPIGILSTLLKHKHHVNSLNFQQTTSPLQSLANEAEERVTRLTTKLKNIEAKKQQAGWDVFLDDLAAAVSDDATASSSEAETMAEEHVRIETKLELWTILWKDITSTMK